MLRSDWTTGIATAGLALGLSGCFAYNQGVRDIDRHPTVDTGVGASILMPGQAAPTLRPQLPARGHGQPAGSHGQPGAAGSEAVTAGVAATTSPPMTAIGGSRIDEQTHLEWKEEPQFHKYLMAPLALIAAPFKKLLGESTPPETGPPVPEQSIPRPTIEPKPAPLDYETAQLEAMEQELSQRALSSAARPGAPQPQTAASTAGASGISIADELAALQRSPSNPVPPRVVVRQPVEIHDTPTLPSTRPPPLTTREQDVADGIVDRNDDGRIDMWIYRTNGHITRKQLDQNFDGRPDTTHHYDPVTHQLSQVTEDSNHDGAIDSWTDYRDGSVVRRRVDSNGDGSVDTWTYYRNGKIARHEQDTTGDGFRDRAGFYRDGRLSHEELDSNADGLIDITNHYDGREQLTRREEDTDLDGKIDVISHYEGGRLARKELLGDTESIRR